MKKFSPFIPRNFMADGVLPVCEADESQRRAVALALKGESFVLNGPPGTGKSHTIALTLVSALYAGKRVLFAAQKPSALQVVYGQLESFSLAKPFLLYDGDDKKVLSSWETSLSRAEPSEEKNFCGDRYYRELMRAERSHEKLHEEPSLYRKIEEYFSLPEEDEISLDESFFSGNLTKKRERCEELLYLYATLSQSVFSRERSLACYGEFSACRRELFSLGVRLSDGAFTAESLRKGFEKSFCKGYCSALLQAEFPDFSSFAQNSVLERLRFLRGELWQEAREAALSRYENTVCALKSRRGYERERKKLSAARYRKEIDGNPFAEFPLLSRISPCVLTSVSLAARVQGKFDLVVFDEASQILKSDALAVAQKAKSVIVVGDEKQLPPTTFFSSAKGEEKQSILEYASACGVKKLRLDRHYRSRKQDLIEFSGRRFYGGELYSLPAIRRETGLVLHEGNGVYEKKSGKVNRSEARSLVERAADLLQSAEGKDKTIGIVTLSASQRDETEKLLFSCLRRRKISPERVKRAKPFVRNLETVQGEERDIILISLGFGKDEEGKLSLRFGPLNHEGGERRLNVALTRARERTEIFSSLPESFLRAKTTNEGILALQELLRLCKGEICLEKKNPVSPIALDLCRRLRRSGFHAEAGIGNEKFCLDVAVRSGKNYRLGVILDKACNTVRETLFLTDVLKGAGWNVVCLYAVDYFRSPERETEKIISLLQKMGVKPAGTKEKGRNTIWLLRNLS